MRRTIRFADDRLLQIGALAFHCEYPIRQVPEGRLPVEKPRAHVEAYIELTQTIRPNRIVELGVFKGGSTALLSELASPEKFVAIELSERPVPVLVHYIEARGLSQAIRPYFGVDQADRARVAAIIDSEFGGKPIDLVIDDASHLYDESVASFEVLFPRLRPGGLYVIEDWRWQHQIADGAAASLNRPDLSQGALDAIARGMREAEAAPPFVPLSRFVLELVLARASDNDVVAEVEVGPYWAVVRRGPADLAADTFSVADTVHDVFDLLQPKS